MLLQDNNINYCEYNIEESKEGENQYKKYRGTGVPLLVIHGKVVRGYNKKKILRLAKQ